MDGYSWNFQDAWLDCFLLLKLDAVQVCTLDVLLVIIIIIIIIIMINVFILSILLLLSLLSFQFPEL